MKQKLLLLFSILLALKSIAQDDTKIFYGKTYDELGVLANAHIININTKKATFSRDDGTFKISVRINDSLKFTSVGYKTIILIVKPIHLGMNETTIILKKEIYELDEVEVKNHNLTGSLTLDLKQTPKDRKAEALANTMDFSKINMKTQVKDDYIDRHVRPHKVETDPIAMNAGAGSKMTIPSGYLKRLRALRKDLAFKTNMPTKLLSELGEDFFFKNLKIPVDKYYHFLEYCNPLGIEKLYQEGKVLEVIKILRNEHTEYLKIIKKK